MPRSRGLLENDKQLLGISLFQLYRHTISSDCSTQKKKVKSLLFNVGSSFSCETGINGSRRCALYPSASVSALFYGYSKL